MALRKGTKTRRETVPPPLHELESEVMEEVWRSGDPSARSVMDALNHAAPKRRAYTTYMTIMARLHKKGLLSRRREGKTDYYAPQFSRDDYLAVRAQSEVCGARRPVRGRRAQPLRTADVRA